MERESAGAITVTVGQTLSQRELLLWLDGAGYRQEGSDQSGQYRHSGEVVSIWPVNRQSSVAVSYFGNEIESIKEVATRQDLTTVEIATNMVLLDSQHLSPGDYLVHIDYGVGRFLTLRTIQGEVQIVCEYANDDRLYVPMERKDKLFPYQFVSRRPKLAFLSRRQVFGRARKKIEESIERYAKDLLAAAAARAVTGRSAYSIDDEWLQELARSCAFTLTHDQATALAACLGSLKEEQAMDRLLLGDVGFGKTEIAIRLAAAAISSNKQVVMLVPTIILLAQHLAVFRDRLKELPIFIEGLDRTTSVAARRQLIERFQAGKIDLLIGTHSVLTEKLASLRLGLLIIDEEQRFGVMQKEFLKKYQATLDILSLSATPIPRTLFMALGGLRELSLLAEPPIGRQAIQSFVSGANIESAISAITREIDRGGQVYLVHNRVATIRQAAEAIRKLLPEGITVEVIHGQLPDQTIAEVMSSFSRGESDVLVASSIIQNGLDLPRANTIIINHADRFGLADLYQLRGRVGRSKVQAFAYFFHGNIFSRSKKSALLAGHARERLLAIVEHSGLGEGYAIATKDLEIRGGGNLLGREQHGNLEAIGIALYSRLLTLAIEKIRNTPADAGVKGKLD